MSSIIVTNHAIATYLLRVLFEACLSLHGRCGQRRIRNYRFFADDGISGTTFNRPDFKKMDKMIESGEIGTVIVKDYCAIIGLNQKDLENQGILA